MKLMLRKVIIMSDRDKNVIDVDAVTLIAVIVAILFIPLLLTGLFAH
jgi:hypothetical protein